MGATLHGCFFPQIPHGSDVWGQNMIGLQAVCIASDPIFMGELPPFMEVNTELRDTAGGARQLHV